MSNKYDTYMKMGRALKNGDEKMASDIAKIIIKSDRFQMGKGIYFDEELFVTRCDKKILKGSN